MLTSREGVIGAQMPLKELPEHHKPGPSALDLWSPAVRQRILEAELLSGLSYDAAENSVCVEYRDRTGIKPNALVHMIRPDVEDFAGIGGAKRQLDYVYNYAALRADRAGEIIAEMTEVMPLFGAVCGLNPPRHRHTLEVIQLVWAITINIEMRLKHALACRRPVEYSAQIQPMIQTPAHGSLPSGHATEAFVRALVLYWLMRFAKGGSEDESEVRNDPIFIQLMRHAERVAVNRTVAGVHFPVDSVAGMVLAQTLAEFFVARLSGMGKVWTRTLDGRGFRGDFTYKDVLLMRYQKGSDTLADDGPNPCIVKSDEPVSIGCSDLLHYLWAEALCEWRPRDSKHCGGYAS